MTVASVGGFAPISRAVNVGNRTAKFAIERHVQLRWSLDPGAMRQALARLPLLNLSSLRVRDADSPRHLLSLAIAVICSTPLSVHGSRCAVRARTCRRTPRAVAGEDRFSQLLADRIPADSAAPRRADRSHGGGDSQFTKSGCARIGRLIGFRPAAPLPGTLQDLRMCLLEAELRLRDLWAERNNLVRFRTPEWRELELRVHDARVRVAEIEAVDRKSARMRRNCLAG